MSKIKKWDKKLSYTRRYRVQHGECSPLGNEFEPHI